MYPSGSSVDYRDKAFCTVNVLKLKNIKINIVFTKTIDRKS